ncbi:MAG: diguanylate cyclase [Proteocatella sp.]
MILLHVEKDFGFCRLIKNIVEKNGFVYMNAFSYEEAYRILLRGNVDLLILSEYMDTKDCNELISKIHHLSNLFMATIIIADEYNYDRKQLFLEAGVMSYLTRNPFLEERFEKYIRTARQGLELLDELRSLNIVVVDDSSFTISTIRRYFEMHKVLNVDYFQDSEEFFNSDKAYDIYLFDYVMPKFDGEDLIYKIREQSLDSMIILVTAHDNQKTIAHCLGIGADDYILKPLDEKLFMLRIISCLHKLKIKKENIKSNKMLFELATRDNLTGLYNRNYFVDMYSKKIHESLRNKSPVTFILVDIDKFKSINDKYGHLTGDYVLRTLANILREKLRESDVICRWGGEEFLVMCPDTNLDRAIFVAEKIRKAVAEYIFKNNIRSTISLGVTQWREDDQAEDVFKRADNSLYLAKLTGRNRTVYEEYVNIDRNLENVVSIEWGGFFESGNTVLDLEHSSLIRLTNEIIDTSLFEKNIEKLKQLLEKIIFDSKVHFKSEEEILENEGYEKLEEHKKLHFELMEKMEELKEKFYKGKIDAVEVARYVVQEFVIGHIIKEDFKFFNIFIKRR